MNSTKRPKALSLKILSFLLVLSLFISGCSSINIKDDTTEDENLIRNEEVDNVEDENSKDDNEAINSDQDQPSSEETNTDDNHDSNEFEDDKNNSEFNDSTDTPVITAEPGTSLLGEAFNVDERLDIALSGSGTLTYFVNDVQVFGGLFEDGDKVHIIVGNNSKLVLTDTLSGDITVNNKIDTNNLLQGMYEGDVDFPFGTYMVSIDFNYPPSTVTILSNLNELEIVDMTLVDDTNGNNIQYSIDKNQIVVFENANSISLTK